MKYDMNLPNFENRTFYVQDDSIWKAPKVILDNEIVKKHRGSYLVTDSHGEEVKFKIIRNALEKVPAILINKEKKPLTEDKYKWHEVVFIGWPFLLLFIGGGLGALFGGWAAANNANIFKNNKKSKYMMSILSSFGILFIYFLLLLILVIIFPELEE